MTDRASANSDAATELDANPAPAGPTSLVYLVVRNDERSELIDLAVGQEVTLGRGADCRVRIDDARVSRRHARISHLSDGVLLEDFGSRNGTRVNDTVVTGAARKLQAGDVVWLAGVELVVARAPAAGFSPEREDADLDGIVVADPEMVRLFEAVKRVAAAPTTVLILGETGVGKEVVAEQIHRASPRADRVFVRLNCAALPESLLEAELFGHEKGAFSGADKRKIGYFEAADGGTLFLDEIGEVSPAAQVRLLRLLESRSFSRLGSTQECHVDVRFLCATNSDLRSLVSAGKFREDLYYRVSSITLTVPPLRDRPVEVSLLAERFAARLARHMNLAPAIFSAEVQDAFAAHTWPGNVRELRSAVEHAVVMAGGGLIQLAHLPDYLRSAGTELPTGPLREQVKDVERRNLLAALAANDGNRTRAAEQLGISRRALAYKLAKYRIQ